ncbi:DUF3226 domain-containing protein [Paraburkholderia sp. BR10936]|uniref:DUF3226 domain-containing protein n=1 Tax=Paraburkholderia sp. BR10936 TaxID=3236993 RepID=UPI0034D1B483
MGNPLMMMEIKKPKLLLVEGQDEIAFMGALFQVMNITDVQLWDAKGKTKMHGALGAVRLAPGFEAVTSIGVIRDADENAQGAFDSVKSSLATHGYPVPRQVGERAAKDGLTASVFIVPGNDVPGMLETLVWQSFEHEEVAQEAARFVERCSEILPAEQEGEQRAAGPSGWRRPRSPEKARMQAFLATMIEALPRMGMGAEKGYFDLTHESFAALRGYIADL